VIHNHAPPLPWFLDLGRVRIFFCLDCRPSTRTLLVTQSRGNIQHSSWCVTEFNFNLYAAEDDMQDKNEFIGICTLLIYLLALSGAVALAAGYSHTCALLTDGSVNCWGDNDFGQLGFANRIRALMPQEVTMLNTGLFSPCTSTILKIKAGPCIQSGMSLAPMILRVPESRQACVDSLATVCFPPCCLLHFPASFIFCIFSWI
jgi:hypothetical protein